MAWLLPPSAKAYPECPGTALRRETEDKMNRDEMQGKLTELRGRIKQKWGRLTDDEIAEAEGDRDILAGKIQQKYGGSKEDIKHQLERM